MKSMSKNVKQPAKRAEKSPAKPTSKKNVKPNKKQPVKPAEKRTAKPSVKKTVKPTEKRTAKPAPKKTVKPTKKQPVKPAEKRTAKPIPKKIVEPTKKQSVKPAERLLTKPTPKKIAKPAEKRPPKPVEEYYESPTEKRPDIPILLITHSGNRLNEITGFIKNLVRDSVRVDVIIKNNAEKINAKNAGGINIITDNRADDLYGHIKTLQHENNYALICIDGAKQFPEYKPIKIHELWDEIDAIILVLPENENTLTAKNLIIPTDYRLLPEKNIRQIKWLLAQTDINVDFLHVGFPEERMESLYDADDSDKNRLFTKDVKNKLDNSRIAFHFIDNDDISEGIKEFIKNKTTYLLAITYYKKKGLEKLFSKNISLDAGSTINIPFVIFNHD